MEQIIVMKPKTECGCLICPNCGAHEIVDCQNKDKIDPIEWRWNIRPYKVDEWSHCLKCDRWF